MSLYIQKYQADAIKKYQQSRCEIDSFYNGINYFRAAIKNNNIEALKWLKTRFSFIPEAFQNDLIRLTEQSCFNPYLDVAQWLIEHGVDVNAMNHQGQTFVSAILSRNDLMPADIDAFFLAINHSAEADNAVTELGAEVVLKAIPYSELNPDYLRLIQWILSKLSKEAINAVVEYHKYSPYLSLPPVKQRLLESACKSGNEVMVLGMLARGADPAIYETEDLSALHIACGARSGDYRGERMPDSAETVNPAIVKALLDHNAPLNIGTLLSPLGVLLFSGYASIDLVELMLRKGANINHGSIPAIHVAVMNSNQDAVNLFVSTGRVSKLTMKEQIGEEVDLLDLALSGVTTPNPNIISKLLEIPALAARVRDNENLFDQLKMTLPTLDLSEMARERIALKVTNFPEDNLNTKRQRAVIRLKEMLVASAATTEELQTAYDNLTRLDAIVVELEKIETSYTNKKNQFKLDKISELKRGIDVAYDAAPGDNEAGVRLLEYVRKIGLEVEATYSSRFYRCRPSRLATAIDTHLKCALNVK